MKTLRQQLKDLEINMLEIIQDRDLLFETVELRQAYLIGLEKLMQFEQALAHLKTLLDKDHDAKQHKLNASKD